MNDFPWTFWYCLLPFTVVSLAAFFLVWFAVLTIPPEEDDE
jgi:hypothetical protein